MSIPDRAQEKPGLRVKLNVQILLGPIENPELPLEGIREGGRGVLETRSLDGPAAAPGLKVAFCAVRPPDPQTDGNRQNRREQPAAKPQRRHCGEVIVRYDRVPPEVQVGGGAPKHQRRLTPEPQTKNGEKPQRTSP